MTPESTPAPEEVHLPAPPIESNLPNEVPDYTSRQAVGLRTQGDSNSRNDTPATGRSKSEAGDVIYIQTEPVDNTGHSQQPDLARPASRELVRPHNASARPPPESRSDLRRAHSDHGQPTTRTSQRIRQPPKQHTGMVTYTTSRRKRGGGNSGAAGESSRQAFFSSFREGRPQQRDDFFNTFLPDQQKATDEASYRHVTLHAVFYAALRKPANRRLPHVQPNERYHQDNLIKAPQS